MTTSTPRPPDLSAMGQADVLGGALADVALVRERSRRARLTRLAVVLGGATFWLWLRVLQGRTMTWGLPDNPIPTEFVPGAVLVLLLSVVLLAPLLGAGRSPHVLYRSGEIDVSLDDVKGAGVVREEVVRTLNLFLAYRTFRDTHGRHAPAGDPLRGPARGPARPTWPRPWPARRACRSSSCPPPPSSRCTTARPTARSAATSGPCARPPGGRAGPSASSRRSTPSAAPARAWAAPAARASPAS